ncbi:MAG: hypothetical protein C4309_03590 [Chloroflexota bacterium]
MQELFRLIASLLSIALIVLIPLVVYSAVLERTLFNPDFYKAALVRHDAYNRLPLELVDEVVRRTLTQAAPIGVRSLLNNVSSEDWRIIVPTIAPPAWLRGVIESNIDALFVWAAGNAPYPRLSIPVGPVRDRLRTGPGGRQLISAMLENQPPCTPQQVQAMLATNSLAACAPPASLLDRVAAAAPAAFVWTHVAPEATAVHGIDGVQGAWWPEDPTDPLGGLNPRSFRLTRAALPLGMATVLLFLGLIHLLAVRSWQGWAQWLGVLLFITGGVTLIPLLLVPAWLEQSFAELIARPLSGRPLLAVIHLGQWLAEDFSAEMVRLAGLAGGGMVLVGLFLLILSIFLPAGEHEAYDYEEELETS